MTSIDWPSVRAGIANVLSTIPELKRVNPYEVKGEARNSTPYATLYRELIEGPGMSLSGEDVGDEGLGQYSHLVTWRIEIYATIRNPQDAQQMDDLFAMRLLDAFNSNRLIDPNGPGVVDNSRMTQITPFEMVAGGNQPLWLTVATLQTKIISTL
jgi:hypothetical protein